MVSNPHNISGLSALTLHQHQLLNASFSETFTLIIYHFQTVKGGCFFTQVNNLSNCILFFLRLYHIKLQVHLSWSFWISTCDKMHLNCGKSIYVYLHRDFPEIKLSILSDVCDIPNKIKNLSILKGDILLLWQALL